VDDLMATFLRRVYLLDPSLRRIGFGCALDVGRVRHSPFGGQRRFAEVRTLAHSVLFELYDSIKDLPGSTKARDENLATLAWM
jgi:hypothetical protein